MLPKSNRPPFRRLSRRDFLKLAAGAGSALIAAACAPLRKAAAPPTPAAPAAVPTAAPTVLATATSTPAPTAFSPTPSPAWRSLVSIARVPDYDPTSLRRSLEEMLSSLGGPGDWVKHGARVGIKVNLTGGTWWDGPGKPPATEYFVTHPAVVEALGEILLDLGAGKLIIMDGLGDPTSFDAWGYTAAARRLGAHLVDLCDPAPYQGFKVFPVGPDPQIYDRFSLHASLAEIDGLISVAKLKCHATTGVTLSLKNLIGLAPTSEYRLHPKDNNRSAFHGLAAYDTRLPGVIMDLNRAVPVRLAVIDGVMTAEGGAGPWQETLHQVKPGVLIAGRDPVAADAAGTAVMGFSPEAEGGQQPFLHGENYLAAAARLGLGTHRLAEIGISGLSIQEARYPFKPAP